MTLSSSPSNNGHLHQFKTTSNIAGDPETQFEDTLSPAEIAEIWAKRAYELAKEPPVVTTGKTMDLLIFWLHGERYGLGVSNVREIYPLEQVTPVPRTPNFVTGVFSARGRILSVIDLGVFFGLSPAAVNGAGKERSEHSKIIVVANTDPTSKTAGMELGLLVETVDDVVIIFKEDLEPALTTHSSVQAEYLQGITADMLAVLNLNAMLSDKRLVVYEEII